MNANTSHAYKNAFFPCIKSFEFLVLVLKYLYRIDFEDLVLQISNKLKNTLRLGTKSNFLVQNLPLEK